MSEQQKPTIFTYRLITIAGMIVDFQSPNVLEGMWSVLRGDGFFQITDADGRAVRRIPFHAIADLQYFDPGAAALAYVAPSSLPRA